MTMIDRLGTGLTGWVDTQHGLVETSGVFSPMAFTPGWRAPRGRRDDSPYAETFMTCGYCGSISPEDLYHAATLLPIRFDPADQKYGYLHKFYIEGIPNPIAGQLAIGYTRSYLGDDGVRQEERHDAPAPTFVHAKFYTRHLDELEDPARTAMLALFTERTDWDWGYDGKVWYRVKAAP